MVEIEISNYCNRKCWYCPNSDEKIETQKKDMNPKLYERIIGELKEFGFSGRLSFHLYNEPLLSPYLKHFISYTKSELPTAKQVLFTNGDYLTDECYFELLKLGIQKFIVTSHSYHLESERENQIIIYPSQLNLTNRGGRIILENENKRNIHAPCYAPTDLLVIDVEGRVLLCYEDSYKNNVMGDINRDKLKEIWCGQHYTHARSDLRNGYREKFTICSICNNYSHLKQEYYDFKP